MQQEDLISDIFEGVSPQDFGIQGGPFGVGITMVATTTAYAHEDTEFSVLSNKASKVNQEYLQDTIKDFKKEPNNPGNLNFAERTYLSSQPQYTFKCSFVKRGNHSDNATTFAIFPELKHQQSEEKKFKKFGLDEIIWNSVGHLDGHFSELREASRVFGNVEKDGYKYLLGHISSPSGKQ